MLYYFHLRTLQIDVLHNYKTNYFLKMDGNIKRKENLKIRKEKLINLYIKLVVYPHKDNYFKFKGTVIYSVSLVGHILRM